MPLNELAVWLDDQRVGTLTTARDGGLRFRYDDATLDRWPGNTPLVSCSLPVNSRAQRADAFFEGLLPEGGFRERLAARAGLVPSNALGLLSAYGRDIAGALVVAETDDGHRKGDVIVLSEDDLSAEVEALDTRPLGVHDDSELSIAGLQDKMLLVALDDGRWGRPTHGRPSTHILKLDHRVHGGLVAAEHDCLALARAVGLPASKAQLRKVGSGDCIVVERFDRVTRVDATGSMVTSRVHQEDACQALGVDPRRKYEVRNGGGGPELSQIAGLFARFAIDPTAEMEALVGAVTFRVLIGDADAHGKNVSIVHDHDGNIALAPLYDTVPTVLWPSLTTDAAMTVAGRLHLATIRPADVATESARWGMARDSAFAIALGVAERVRSAVVEDHVTVHDDRLRSHLLAAATRFLDAGLERPER